VPREKLDKISNFFNELVSMLAFAGLENLKRMRAEEMVRQTQKQFSFIASHIDDILWICTPAATEFLYVSPAYERLLGEGSATRLMENPSAVTAYAHPEDRESLGGWVRELGSDDLRREIVYRYVRDSGEVRWARTRSFPVKTSEGVVRQIVCVTTDITTVKLAEEALTRYKEELEELVVERTSELEKSESRFRMLVDSMSDEVFLIGRSMQIEAAFGKWIKAEGLKTEAIVGLTPAQFLGDESGRIFKQMAQKAFTGEPAVFELSVKLRNRQAEVQYVLSPIKGKEGGVTHLVAVGRDITELRDAEKSSRERLDFINSIIGSAAEGLCVMNQNAESFEIDFSIWNSRMTEITGYSMEEMNAIGWSVLYPKSPEVARSRLRALFDGEVMESEEYTITCKDGSRRVVSVSTSTLMQEVGELTRHELALISDVTEQRRALDELSRSEEKFRHLFEDAPMGIALMDIEGTLLLMNGALMKFTGFSGEEAVGRKFSEFLLTDDRARDEALFKKVGQGKLERQIAERELKTRTGDSIWINSSLTLVRDSAGRPSTVLAMLEDITNRKRLEAQLLEAHKLQAIGTLAGGVAHDFNNILMAVLGYAEMGYEDLDESSPQREFFAQIISSAERATEIVKQVLTFSQEREASSMVTDVGEVVREAITLSKPSLPRGTKVEDEFPKARVYADIDAGQIQQVLMNVFANSRDALVGVEGPTLHVQVETLDLEGGEPLTDGTTLNSGSYVWISVIDNGPGMDEETAQRVFEPYFTTKEVGKGSGLGLAVAHGIIQTHNGQISIVTAPGEGVRVNIYLPRAEGELVIG
jgi:PAS domain S-box-containing protein